MKKLTSIAAAICLATAFCGMCTGCADEIERGGMSQKTPAVVSAAEDGEPVEKKVILCPGYAYGYGSAANTVDIGAIKFAAADEEKYFVSNAYFADVPAGAELPAATTTRNGATFVGWTRAVDGVVVTEKIMPVKAMLKSDLFLYAKWSVKGDIVDPGLPATNSYTVNGTALAKNPNADTNNIAEEYFVENLQLEKDVEVVFKNNDSPITITELDSASTGLAFAGGKITTTKVGKFSVYLKKKKTGTWAVYAAWAIDPDTVTIRGEAATAGNVYLAGNISGADFSWSNWNATGHKGLKATKGADNKYTLEVNLTAGDNCKFVMVAIPDSDMKWQKKLDGGGNNIGFADENANMIVKTTGTYRFTITVETAKLSVSVVKV